MNVFFRSHPLPLRSVVCRCRGSAAWRLLETGERGCEIRHQASLCESDIRGGDTVGKLMAVPVNEFGSAGAPGGTALIEISGCGIEVVEGAFERCRHVVGSTERCDGLTVD